jgi:hypothetical protein
MCFIWISEQTGIISVCSINWLVFITEMESVYCAVRTESSDIIDVKFSLKTVNLFLYQRSFSVLVSLLYETPRILSES